MKDRMTAEEKHEMIVNLVDAFDYLCLHGINAILDGPNLCIRLLEPANAADMADLAYMYNVSILGELEEAPSDAPSVVPSCLKM